MRLDLQSHPGAYAIRSYRRGAIVVNEETLTQSFIITPTRLLRDWPPQRFDEVLLEHVTAIAQLKPEIVLFGTGTRLRFPPADIAAGLLSAGIGFEVMDTAAACRSYIILLSEDRNVAAALLMIE
ncbi:MAG: Mth938-like domain-containing protein [Chromatiales bacterium]